MDRLETLRPVGRLERYSTARHHLRFYVNAAVTATYTIPATYIFSLKDYIYKACEALIGQHPILSAIPVGEDTTNPYFARLPQVNLDQCIFFQERQYPQDETQLEERPDPELEDLLNLQHNKPFAPPAPFWRLCILTNAENRHQFTAAFIFHHAIADGTSGKAFHRIFLRALHDAGSLSPSEVKKTVSSPRIPLLPNLEAVHPMTLSIPYIFSVLFKEKIWASRNPKLWTGSKIITPLENHFRHIVFAKEVTRSLKNLCHQHRTTITATLQTVVAAALFTHLPDHFSSLHCVGALSNRRWLPVDIINDDSIGVWVQDYHETYDRGKVMKENHNESFPWAEARRSRQTIESVLSLQGKNASPSMLKYVKNYQRGLFLSKVGTERATSYEVSNVGVFRSDFPLDGKDPPVVPTIGRMLFSQSANVTGSAFEVSAITGEDGCLVLAFSWQKGVVEDELIGLVVETVSEELNRLGSVHYIK